MSDPIDLTQLLNPYTASDNDYMLAASVSGIANSLCPAHRWTRVRSRPH